MTIDSGQYHKSKAIFRQLSAICYQPQQYIDKFQYTIYTPIHFRLRNLDTDTGETRIRIIDIIFYSFAEFIKGQIEDIPLPDSSVDVILSNCVINLSPDKEKTLSEAFRVLRPGGRLAISDIVVDGGLDDLPVSESQVRIALNWAGCIAGAMTVDEFQDTLANVGFAEVDVDIQHHYTLEALGQDMDQIELELPPEVIHKIVGRFAGSHISGLKK